MGKSAVSYLLRVILLAIVFTLILWKVTPTKYQNDVVDHSPLPSFLTLFQNSQVRTLDLWFPGPKTVKADEPAAQAYTAKSILMYDLTADKILFQKDPNLRLPMASLTKIMTAIISLQSVKSPDTYVVPAVALVGEDSMGLTTGETLTHTDLLYGLMLNSGNDAAEVLSRNYPGGREGFVQAMNDKAQALGLTNTHFTNPTGLQGDGDQHTTAADLLVITKYALETYPEFAEAGSTYVHEVPATAMHKAYTLYNETNLLTTYPGVTGLKTGYTPEAGLCLVTKLDYGGHQIIGILLGSENRRGEMKTLLDYSLTSLGIKPPPFSG